MTWRPVSLTATTVLAASLVARADTPTPTPSPAPSPAARSPRARVSPTPKAPSPSPEPSKAPGRVFTNEDLPAVPSPPAIASPGPAGTGRGTVTTLPKSAVSPTPTPSPDAAAAEAAQQEVLWRGRAYNLRDTIASTEKKIAELQERIDGLRNDRNPTNLMDPNREQNRQAAIAKAQAELETAQAGLAASRQALADLEEEARRKGIPPGWLRER